MASLQGTSPVRQFSAHRQELQAWLILIATFELAYQQAIIMVAEARR